MKNMRVFFGMYSLALMFQPVLLQSEAPRVPRWAEMVHSSWETFSSFY